MPLPKPNPKLRAANTLYKGRAQLALETVKALESIKSWLLQGISRVVDISQIDRGDQYNN